MLICFMENDSICIYQHEHEGIRPKAGSTIQTSLCGGLSVYVKILHNIYSVIIYILYIYILVENALFTSLTAPHTVGCMHPFSLIQQYNRKSILM